MNEMECGLKEIKMKHDQWSVDLRKWDETWTMKCGLTDMIWNMNNEVNNVTNSKNLKSILYAFVNVIDALTVYYSCKRFLPCVQLDKFYWRKDFWYHFYLCKNQTKTDKLKLEPVSQLIFTLCPRTKKKHWCNRIWFYLCH